MRLPNGFGRITELKNRNLRKPFRVMVSDGKDESGRPIGKLLKPVSYFETYNEAYKALMAYHENPYALSNDSTLKDLYERWFKDFEKTVTPAYLRGITSAWDYCHPIHDMKIQALRARDYKPILESPYKIDKKGDKIEASPVTKKRIRNVLSAVLDYAIEYELIPHNYIKDIKPKGAKSKAIPSHISFTDKEMEVIKDNLGSIYFDMAYVSCYMGWRPQELLDLEISNVKQDEMTITGGSKTNAGRNRTVPVHRNIQALILKYYNYAVLNGCRYLFTYNRKKIPYATYRYGFINTVNKKGLSEKHRPHDCRKQFVTMAKKAGVDEYAIKRIVGHSISDVTEDVYTYRDIEWLRNEINKIP